MKSRNHNIEHGDIHFIHREKEIIIIHNNKEIATLVLDTMDDHEGNPTENFWLSFIAKHCYLDKCFADVIVDPYQDPESCGRK